MKGAAVADVGSARGTSTTMGSVAPDVGDPRPATPLVQTIGLVYTRLHGIPIDRAARAQVGWYGDMEMLGHAWQLLKAGPLDVAVRIGAPQPLAAFADRKQIAQRSEIAVRQAVVGLLRGWRIGEAGAVADPPQAMQWASPQRRSAAPSAASPGKPGARWT